MIGFVRTLAGAAQEAYAEWREYEAYGWIVPNVAWIQPPERVPVDERCWRCQTTRIHEGCAAELCGGCCAELRRLTA